MASSETFCGRGRGTSTLALHTGHRPETPACESLTFKTCPFWQTHRIDMADLLRPRRTGDSVESTLLEMTISAVGSFLPPRTKRILPFAVPNEPAKKIIDETAHLIIIDFQESQQPSCWKHGRSGRSVFEDAGCRRHLLTPIAPTGADQAGNCDKSATGIACYKLGLRLRSPSPGSLAAPDTHIADCVLSPDQPGRPAEPRHGGREQQRIENIQHAAEAGQPSAGVLAPTSRFSSDSARSPTMPAVPTSRPKTIHPHHGPGGSLGRQRGNQPAKRCPGCRGTRTPKRPGRLRSSCRG